MKTNFPKESQSFESTIRRIADKVVELAPDKIAFVILFGSFAKGTWVFDRYSEENTTYTYASDYDFLIVTKERNNKKNGISDSEFEREIREIAYSKYGHNPHFVVEPIEYVNSELEKGRYFFSDIKKEGILLYDSGEFKLADAKILSAEEVKKIAQDDYKYWFNGGLSFLDITPVALKETFSDPCLSCCHTELRKSWIA